MAVENLIRLTCDRCGSVMEEGEKAAAADEEAPIQLSLEGDLIGSSVSFYDVCEKCCERVKNLLDQITLAPKEKNAEAKPKRRKNAASDEQGTAEAPN